jgi:hypothetical protein
MLVVMVYDPMAARGTSLKLLDGSASAAARPHHFPEQHSSGYDHTD